MDKSWLLNPTAVKAARRCIQMVDAELQVKLKLSHPDFLDLLYDYCELCDSDELTNAFNALISMAGAEVKSELESNHPETNVTPIRSEFNPAQTPAPQANEEFVDDAEMVEYRGRTFKRWKDGMEFQGLYRGQARYA